MKSASSEVVQRQLIQVKDDFWLSVIVEQVVAGESPWLCAYAQLPWTIVAGFDVRDSLIEQLHITYMGPGQATWNLEKGHTPGTWIGIDWYQRQAPAHDKIITDLKIICEVLNSRRKELGDGDAGA